MKKFISLALCLVMLFTVAAVSVSAEEIIDCRFLTDYGQTIYFMEASTTAPVIDAAIQENEYSIKVVTDTTDSTIYDTVNDSTQGGTWGIETATYYLAWDEECLYVAAEVVDNTPTQYNQWSGAKKRADQFMLALGGMIDTPTPEGIASRLEFRFFDSTPDTDEGVPEDYFEIQDVEKDFMAQNVSGAMLDTSSFCKEHIVVHNPDTKITTYEIAINWEAIKAVWPHHEGELQYKLFTFGMHLQDTSDEINAQGVGTKVGIKWWGNVGEEVNALYDKIWEQHDSAAYYGFDITEPIVPNMFFLGTEEEYEAFKAERVAAPETEPVETEPVETEPVETEPTETEPVETEPVETEPTETKPVETQPTEPEAKGGCGGSVAAIAVALVAVLGTCTAFISKKR